MNALVNRVQLIGSLGKDPEVITYDSNKKLTKISLATNETYKNAKGEKVTDTTWHNITAFGNTAGILEKYAKKGDKVCIEGKLSNNQYQDKDGNQRYKVEIIANDVLLLSPKKES